MLKHYFILTLRHFWRNKFYTFISVMGLSLGIAAFLVVVQYISFELSYEDMHPHSERVYRVTQDFYKGSEYVVTDCETPMPLAPLLKEKFPAVEQFVRVQDIDEVLFEYEGKTIRPEIVYAVDPSFFDIFGYQILRGSPQREFEKPFTAVVTKSFALKHFGKVNAVGEILRSKASDRSLEIVGVVEDVPLNTHLKFDLLFSFETLRKLGWDEMFTSWTGNNNFTYFRAGQKLDIKAFNQQLATFSNKIPEKEDKDIFQAECIRDIHLYSHKTFEPETNSDVKVIYFLGIIAAFTILIAIINYINLYSAKALEKSKEISVRQVLGASFREMFFPNLMEAGLLCVFAGLLSLAWMDLGLSFLKSISDGVIAEQMFFETNFWLWFVGILVICTIVAGLYAQFMLSLFKLRDALRGTPKLSRKSLAFQKAFIVGQYVATFALVIGTVIVIKQINYMMSQDLGMQPEQVLVVRGSVVADSEIHEQRSATFKDELKQQPKIKRVASTNTLPGMELHELNTSTGFSTVDDNRGDGINFYFYWVDAHYIPALGMEIISGQNFRPQQQGSFVIMNEESVRVLGFASPEAAIGKKIENGGEFTILGVVKDFHQQSLKEAQIPMLFLYQDHPYGYYALKIQSGGIQETIQATQKTFEEVFPDEPFEYFFLDEHFDRQYHNEIKFAKLSGLFAFLAIFISCIGLVGISSYVALRRSKEVAIRKVLGATVQNLVLVLSGSYLKRIAIACLIATPLTYFALQQWLQGFAYRTEISWWLFPMGALTLITLAFLVMSIQALKAALSNPVHSLRDE